MPNAQKSQPSILASVPPVGRSVTFRLNPNADVREALAQLRDNFDLESGIVGLGEPAVSGLHRSIPGLRTFPAMSGPSVSVPSTQQALWVLLRGSDRGELIHASAKLQDRVCPAFVLHDLVDTFVYAGGRDLSGYEDGTENPKANDAVNAAVMDGPAGLDGSSFVAVQRWVHDLRRFAQFPQTERDAIIGRRQDTNEELGDSPESSHVKRTAQESFDPPAFMWRRSMPWASPTDHGLEFIAFVESLDRFDRMMRRMAGLEDGVTDGLFRFSRAVTGGHYWCPPVADNRLDLSYLGV